MTRARKHGKGPEEFGYCARAYVVKIGRVAPWRGHKPYELMGRPFMTWREAMDYALGRDKP